MGLIFALRVDATTPASPESDERVDRATQRAPWATLGAVARWNSNLHAFDRLLERVSAGTMRGLDVGCGEGETSRRLRRRVPSVIGLDADAASIECARRAGDDIEYIVGDLFAGEVEEDSFDVVTAVAVLHHVDHRRALDQLGRFVRPGGVLLVVGLARSRSVGDYARDVVDSVAVRRHTFVKDVWNTPAPQVWPPPMTYAETRRATSEALPGAAFARVPYFRYTIGWTRPQA